MRSLPVLLVLATVVPALAQTPPPGPPMRGGMLMRADADGDGVVTRAEMTAAADERFARLDANHDGMVTPDERPAMRSLGDGPPPASDGIRRPPLRPLETTTTRDQSRARALELFDRVDANGDGRIDQTELAGASPRRRGVPSAQD